MERCTCRTGRDHDGSEFGPCEHCEELAHRLDLDAGEVAGLSKDAKRWRLSQLREFWSAAENDGAGPFVVGIYTTDLRSQTLGRGETLGSAIDMALRTPSGRAAIAKATSPSASIGGS